jgi:hypothetical protein
VVLGQHHIDRGRSPPGPSTGFISLSPSWGCCVALLAGAAIIGCALWTPPPAGDACPGHAVGDLNL